MNGDPCRYKKFSQRTCTNPPGKVKTCIHACLLISEGKWDRTKKVLGKGSYLLKISRWNRIKVLYSYILKGKSGVRIKTPYAKRRKNWCYWRSSFCRTSRDKISLFEYVHVKSCKFDSGNGGVVVWGRKSFNGDNDDDT